MSFTFDGPNKKIRISSGITYITTVEMYSRWVDWLLTSDNSKYLPAFRTVGGDQLSPTKNLGFTLFLTNDWRIVPQAANHTLVIDGNLYTDPYGGIRVDNVPGYTVLIEYTVSNLTDSSISVLEIDNLQRLIEGLRPHHSGFGNIWYWDPYFGNDNYSGTHPNNAFRTFAAAHNAASDWNHDIIIAHPGNPYTVTTSTENLVITKNYLFLRGPGRDFNLQSADNTKDFINISGTGVEISKINIGNNLNNTKCGIYTSGDFTLIKDIILNSCNNGIQIAGSNRGIIDNAEIEYCNGFGVKISGGAREITLRNSIIGDNGGTGLIIDNIGGDDINIHGDTSIYSNAGYGVNITANTSGVILHENVEVNGNTLGNILDNGIGTVIEAPTSAPSAQENASAVRTNLATELGRIDAAISTRLASNSYVAPDNAAITAIAGYTDSIESRLPVALVNGKMDSNATVSGVPTASENAAAVRTNLNTELSRIDANISSRLSTSSYVAPDNTTITSIESRLPIALTNGKINANVTGIPTAPENAAAVRTNLATELSRIDSSISSSKGLTSDQYTMLLELYRIMGLDPTKPLVVTKTSRDAGAEIHQTISGDDNQATMTRI